MMIMREGSYYASELSKLNLFYLLFKYIRFRSMLCDGLKCMIERDLQNTNLFREKKFRSYCQLLSHKKITALSDRLIQKASEA
jgi:hypothetical protein